MSDTEEVIGKENTVAEDEEMFKKMKSWLLNLLSEEEVREKVTALFPKTTVDPGALKEKDAEIARLHGEKECIREENAALKKTIETAQKETATLRFDLEKVRKDKRDAVDELSALRQKYSGLDKDKRDAVNELSALRQKYSGLDELHRIYEIYNSLPRQTQDSMAGFIKGDSLLAFAASGMRDSRLETFWDFCKTEVQKSGGLQYAGDIASIFGFFFTSMNSATEYPLYELYMPQANTRFSDDSMIVSNSSPAKDGVVERTALPGFRGIKTNKIVKKAVVTLT